jgi:hypothetical protein
MSYIAAETLGNAKHRTDDVLVRAAVQLYVDSEGSDLEIANQYYAALEVVLAGFTAAQTAMYWAIVDSLADYWTY